MPRTRTGTISAGITTSFQSLSDLLLTDENEKNYENVVLENMGDTDLKIATVLAATERSKTLSAGREIYLAQMSLTHTFVKTTNISGSNILEFIGTPENNGV
jgi:hypothetical protein